MPEKLTSAVLKQVAEANGIEARALCALTKVESSGSGFLADGRPKILFERQWLWRRLQTPDRNISPSPLAEVHPELCGSTWDKSYYLGGIHEYGRVQAVVDWAHKHDSAKEESYRRAAWESCSWGLFQILGLHYHMLGYANVDEMVTAFKESEKIHLDGVVKFLAATHILEPLHAHQWTKVATLYNGSGQAGEYALKLEAAYGHCAA